MGLACIARMLFARLCRTALLGIALCVSFTAQAAPSAGAVYKGAIIVDAATGQTLFEDNANVVSPPASVTKLMTFLVIHDQIKKGAITLGTEITVDASDTRMAGTQVWLKEHEVFTVDELLYALMIRSANDAAHALARAAGGSREAFVEMMNARAVSLGMTNTRFTSPHGLPPSKGMKPDLTSPRDLAILSRELLLHTDVLRYSSVRIRDFGGSQRAQPVVMTTHNQLLGKVNGVDGLKTGFTNSAGYCLAATARRGDKRIIAVIMGSTDRKTRDIKMAELIERGFSLTPASSVFTDHESEALPMKPVAATVESAPAGDPGAPVVKFSMPAAPAKKKN